MLLVIQFAVVNTKCFGWLGCHVRPPSKLSSKKTSKKELNVPPLPDPSLTMVMPPELTSVGDSRTITIGLTVLTSDSATISMGIEQFDPADERVKAQLAWRCTMVSVSPSPDGTQGAPGNPARGFKPPSGVKNALTVCR